jgi:argonaute family protein
MSNEIALVLNRFEVKSLTEADRTFWVYTCRFDEPPDGTEFYRRLASVAYRVGVVAVAIRSRPELLTRDPIAPEHLQGEGWGLTLQETRVLDAQRPGDRQILESFERRFLETELRRTFRKLEVERAAEGGLIWWVTDGAGIEKSGTGWEVHRGRHIDIHIEENGQLYLEVDLHYRFHTPQTLHWWVTTFPDIEETIRHVRNTYRKPDKPEPLSWLYESWSEVDPESIEIPNLGISLAEYHRREGATVEEVQTSKVVYVKRQKLDRTPVAHLSQRLTPSLTLEMLAVLKERSDITAAEKSEIESVFACIRKNLSDRLTESQTTANRLRESIYGLTAKVTPLRVVGVSLPKATLLAKGDRSILRVAEVKRAGCAVPGELHLGCLNLFNNARKYPDAVRECLEKVAQQTGVDLHIDSYRTQQDYPDESLAQTRFWRTWASEGIRTVLVVMPRSERKQTIRKQALQAGMATQFMVPLPKANDYKAMNVVLGLLCKAGWQPVRLQPQENWADLVVGFDTGTDRELYYGTSAFAVLADGQSLGWELPNVQTGEKFTGAAIWRTVSNLILRFEEKCDRPPRKVLLMRDGLVQSDEFEETIDHLTAEQIAVDVLGVRKSGTGRLGTLQNGVYQDAPLGSTVFSERSFLMITSQAIRHNLGSARPLRLVHAYGNTPLATLAVQTYHLTQMHPASGFRASRLPWVLHLADRSSKEFQRLGDIGLLQNLDRAKLIAV